MYWQKSCTTSWWSWDKIVFKEYQFLNLKKNYKKCPLWLPFLSLYEPILCLKLLMSRSESLLNRLIWLCYGSTNYYNFYQLWNLWTAASFFFTHYRPLPLFLVMRLSLLKVLFLGASIVCVSNTIYRGQQIVLWFPDRTSLCKHPWHHSA